MTKQDNSALFETTQYRHPFAIFTNVPPFPLHLHKHLEFVYVTDGEIELHLHQKNYLMKKGDCTFIAPYTLHGYTPKNNTCKRFVLVFEPETIGELGDILLEYHPTQPIIPGEALRAALPLPPEELFTSIANIHSHDAEGRVRRFTAIIQLLSTILPLIGMQKQLPSKNSAFIQAINLCNTSYEDPGFSIKSVAVALHISESYLKQLFHKSIGISVKKYLTLLRIGKAEILLAQDSFSIAQIAQAAGFGSVRTFNRVFKEQKGVTPMEYKAAMRQ